MNEEEQKYFKGLIGFTFDSDDIKYIEKIVDKKDKEIERLKEINKELGRDYSSANNGYLRLHSIIKEVRDFANGIVDSGEDFDGFGLKLLEILDKEGDSNE